MQAAIARSSIRIVAFTISLQRFVTSLFVILIRLTGKGAVRLKRGTEVYSCAETARESRVNRRELKTLLIAPTLIYVYSVNSYIVVLMTNSKCRSQSFYFCLVDRG
jgi:hypothetical protein